MKKEVLEKILRAGIQAPSCDNNQSWRIRIKSADEIELLNENIDVFYSHSSNSCCIDMIVNTKKKLSTQCRGYLKIKIFLLH